MTFRRIPKQTPVVLIVSFFLLTTAGAEEKPMTVALPIPAPLDSEVELNVVDEKDLEDKSYRELERMREVRAMLIDYLIQDGKIRENPRGTVDLLDKLNGYGMGVVKSENRIRMKMFEIVADQENRTPLNIGRDFHKMRVGELKQLSDEKEAAKARENAPVIPEDLIPSLSIAAPPSLSATVVRDLAQGYLQSLGYGKVAMMKRGGRPILIGRRSFGAGFIAVEPLSEIPDPKKSRSNGLVVIEAGRLAGTIPSGTVALEGLAIVVSEQNPADNLTASLVADIFSGNITSWDQVPGGASGEISLLLPGNAPDLIQVLHDLVLEPQGKRITSGFDPATAAQSASYLQQLRDNPAAISICRSSDIPGGVRALRVRAAGDTVPLAPTRSNIIALDYPFISYVRIDTVGSRDRFTEDFIGFAQESFGQKIIANAGLAGIQGDIKVDKQAARIHHQILLNSDEFPDSYKDLIRNANRDHTPANFRFLPDTRTFELTDYSEIQFNQLVEYLEGEGKGKTVILLGFADSGGAEDANLIYSGKRADSIADRLREKGITNPIKTEGIGEDVPVADNGTENGRSANRRVEVWIANQE